MIDNVPDELAALRRQLQELQDAQARRGRDLDYRLDVMAMKRAWQDSRADNVDGSHPLKLRLYIPPDTKHIERAYLRFTREYFRSYGTGAASGGGGYTSTGGGGDHRHKMFAFYGLDDPPYRNFGPGGAGAHNHGITNGTQLAIGTSDPHSTVTFNESGRGPSFSKYRAINNATGNIWGYVWIPDDWGGFINYDIYTHDSSGTHTHNINIPDHSHPIIHGIFEANGQGGNPLYQASNMTVVINGQDRTSALGGPFNTDQNGLDITEYLSIGMWNVISLGSATLGRIDASVFVEIYLP